MEADAKELLGAIELLDEVPGRTGYLCSYAVRFIFSKNQIHMWLSSEISAEIVVGCKGNGDGCEVFIDRRLLFPFLKAKVSDAHFQISFKDDVLLVKQGRRKATFSSMSDVKGYSRCPSLSKGKVQDLRAVAAVIKCAATCAINDPVWPQYSCVFMSVGKPVNNNAILATNQVVAFGNFFKKKITDKFPFPLSLINLLTRSDLIATYTLPNLVVIKFPKGYIWQSFSAKASQFPVDRVLGLLLTKGNSIFTVEAKEFIKILDRLSTYLSGVEKKDWSVAFFGKQGVAKVLVKAEVQQAAFSEVLATKGSAKEDFSVKWPLAQVLDSLLFMAKAGKEIKTSVMGDVGYIVSNGETYLAIAKHKDA